MSIGNKVHAVDLSTNYFPEPGLAVLPPSCLALWFVCYILQFNTKRTGGNVGQACINTIFFYLFPNNSPNNLSALGNLFSVRTTDFVLPRRKAIERVPTDYFHLSSPSIVPDTA
jgi:hypothetical protein